MKPHLPHTPRVSLYIGSLKGSLKLYTRKGKNKIKGVSWVWHPPEKIRSGPEKWGKQRELGREEFKSERENGEAETDAAVSPPPLAAMAGRGMERIAALLGTLVPAVPR